MSTDATEFSSSESFEVLLGTLLRVEYSRVVLLRFLISSLRLEIDLRSSLCDLISLSDVRLDLISCPSISVEYSLPCLAKGVFGYLFFVKLLRVVRAKFVFVECVLFERALRVCCSDFGGVAASDVEGESI